MVLLDVSVCSSFRVRSIESDGRYKRTWGTGSEHSGTVVTEGGVVSNQPTSQHNGQATAASGPYVKRYTDDCLYCSLVPLKMSPVRLWGKKISYNN